MLVNNSKNNQNMTKKDTIYIQNRSLDSLNKNIDNLHTDIHLHLNKKEDRFLGATYDTVFTVLITLFVFVAGIIIDRYLKSIQEKKEEKDLRKYFFNQIKEIIELIGPSLTRAYKAYYQNEIGIDQGIPATPPKVLANNFDRLHKIESVKLYSAFSESEKKKFNKYFVNIDFIANLLKEIDSFHSLILTRSEYIRRQINISQLEFHNRTVEFVETIKVQDPNYQENDDFIFLHEKLMLFKNEVDGKRELKLFHDEILLPIIAYMKQNNLRDIEIGAYVYNSGKEIISAYHNLKFLITEVKLEYRKFYIKINESILELEKLSLP